MAEAVCERSERQIAATIRVVLKYLCYEYNERKPLPVPIACIGRRGHLYTKRIPVEHKLNIMKQTGKAAQMCVHALGPVKDF